MSMTEEPSINEGAFKVAFRKAQAKHPDIGEELAKNFLFKYFGFSEKNKQDYVRLNPNELRSKTLNEMSIFGSKRKQYHCLASTYAAECRKRSGAERKSMRRTVPDQQDVFAWPADDDVTMFRRANYDIVPIDDSPQGNPMGCL